MQSTLLGFQGGWRQSILRLCCTKAASGSAVIGLRQSADSTDPVNRFTWGK